MKKTHLLLSLLSLYIPATTCCYKGWPSPPLPISTNLTSEPDSESLKNIELKKIYKAKVEVFRQNVAIQFLIKWINDKKHSSVEPVSCVSPTDYKGIEELFEQFDHKAESFVSQNHMLYFLSNVEFKDDNEKKVYLTEKLKIKVRKSVKLYLKRNTGFEHFKTSNSSPESKPTTAKELIYQSKKRRFSKSVTSKFLIFWIQERKHTYLSISSIQMLLKKIDSEASTLAKELLPYNDEYTSIPNNEKELFHSIMLQSDARKSIIKYLERNTGFEKR